MAATIEKERIGDAAPVTSSEKPGVIERTIVALAGAANLSPDDERHRPIDDVGAFAYAQMADGEIDPRSELAAVLLQLRGDRALGEKAVLLLMRWLKTRKAFGNWKVRAGQDSMLERFVRLALAEWLYPVCPTCKGQRVLGMNKGEIVERRVRCRKCTGTGFTWARSVQHQCAQCRGFGSVSKRRIVADKPEACRACLGSGGRRQDIDAIRIRELRVPEHVYAKFWVRRFAWLAASLDRVDDFERFHLLSRS